MTMQISGAEPRARDTTPYILTSGPLPAAVTFAPGPPVVIGPPAQFVTTDLVNTLRVPIEVTELYFVVTGLNPAARGGTAAGAAPWVELSLTMGSHVVALNAPLLALGVRRDITQENTGGGAPFNLDQTRWVFTRPLVIAPNEGFSGSVRISPLIINPANGNDVVSVYMTARGRRLPAGTPVPRTRAIPYAAGYFYVTTQAPPNTFRNPFPVPLNVATINSLWTLGATSDVGDVRFASPGGLANVITRTAVVNPAPMALVTDERFALQEPHVLEPYEEHVISFTLLSPAAPANSEAQAVVLTGWREE